MKTTVKRLNITLKAEDVQKLDKLCKILGRTPTPTIRLAVEEMYDRAIVIENKETEK